MLRAAWERLWYGARPRFSYQIADRALDLWRCDRCQRIVSQRQMMFHATTKHTFNAPNVRITNQDTLRTRLVPLD